MCPGWFGGEKGNVNDANGQVLLSWVSAAGGSTASSRRERAISASTSFSRASTRAMKAATLASKARTCGETFLAALRLPNGAPTLPCAAGSLRRADRFGAT